MLIYLKWQYLQSTVPGVGTVMDPIEDALTEAFFLRFFGGEEVSAYLREILGHSMKRGVLCIPDLRLLAERAYRTSKADSEVIVGSLLGGSDLNYIVHKGCERRVSADWWKQREFQEIKELTRRKDQSYGAVLNRPRKSTEDGERLTSIPHGLNNTELSREEFQDNLLLKYGIVTLNLPTYCDGCDK